MTDDDAVRLASIFGDNMVLQRDRELPVWGSAAPGVEVRIRVAGREATTAADADGLWSARLDPLPAGGPFELTVTDAASNAACANVLIGDVWVCSGQSNMAMELQNVSRGPEEVNNADCPDLRLITVPRVVADEPCRTLDGHWSECTPQTARDFSAVAYFFGREMNRELGVPIGLVNTSWGGTPAEAWTRMEALEACRELKPILLRWADVLARYPELKAGYDRLCVEWRDAVARAEADHRTPPPAPPEPQGPGHCWQPAGLFNAMIAPLIPFAIRGVIWYQGESNADRAREYRTLFPAMIESWRDAWDRADLPFLFVQLANFGRQETEPEESAWAELREAQFMTLSLPDTGMATAIDIGEADDIHPHNKREVGRRLALAAQATVHGLDVVHSGPLCEAKSVEGDAVRLGFQHIGGGLTTADDGPLSGFAIAGEDRAFVRARAEIDRATVVVRSDAVPEPAAVRYAWANNPVCNLCNEEGLPALPFRTDDWPYAAPASAGQGEDVFPEPEPINIPRAPVGMNVDGDLSDWEAIAPLALPFHGGESGSVRLCWSQAGLYGAVLARSGRPEVDRAAPWQADCLELFLDKDFSRSPTRSEHASQYALAPDPENGTGCGLTMVAYGADIYREHVLRCAWQPTGDGYALEFFIPASLLGPGAMEAGRVLGMNFCLSHGGEPVEQFYSDKELRSGWQSPATWGAVRLG